eukprot:ANDGO_04148.mRNA.1 DNA replication licensing factor MCM5
MSGWDEGGVFVANAGLVDDASEGGLNSDSGLRNAALSTFQARLRDFLRQFESGNEYSYREMLTTRIRTGVFSIPVSLDDLRAYDPALADAIVMQPNTYLPLLDAALLDAARLILHPDELIPLFNAHPAGLPASSNNATAPTTSLLQAELIYRARPLHIRDLSSSLVGRLVVVRGIVIASSKTRAKASSLVLSCRSCRAVKTVSVRPGFSAASIPRKCDGPSSSDATAQCPLDPFVVVADKSTFVDQQTLKLQEPPEAVPTGEMPRHVLCAVDRGLVARAPPGSRVRIVGVYSIMNNNMGPTAGGVALRTPYIRIVGVMMDSLAGTSSSLANSLFSSSSANPSGSNANGGDAERTDGMMWLMSEEEQYKRLAADPQCIDKLVAAMDPAIYGHERIKLAVACLLFGGARKAPMPTGTRVRGDINVLLLGDPSTAKSQFLKFAERVAPVGVYTSGKGSSAAGLTASVVRDPTSGEFYLEGGSMVLADGGVVCIDEFDKMRASDRVAIHEAMEQQTISIAKAGITTVLNARAAVLAAANPLAGRYDDMKTASEQVDFQSTILSRFDLIFIVRDVRDEARDRSLAQHVLGVHMAATAASGSSLNTSLLGGGGDVVAAGAGAGKDGSNSTSGRSVAPVRDELSVDFLRRYIAYCRAHCSPRLSAEAARTLEHFFVQIRAQMRERSRQAGTSVRQIPITVRQLESLVRVSESLAKMTLSTTATVDHINRAIELFKASTMEAANSGMLAAADEYLAPETRAAISRAEAMVQRLVGIGQIAASGKVVESVVSQAGVGDFAVHRALFAMEKRGEIEFLRQKKQFKRMR